MTRSRFLLRLYLVSLIPILVLMSAVVDKSLSEHAIIYSFFKEYSSYVLLLVGPFLGYVFTARQNFVKRLEEEWGKIVKLKGNIVSFTFDPKLETWISLANDSSYVVDSFRIIFKNVGEDRNFIGYYPYETLKEFQSIIHSINPKDTKKFPDGKIPEADLKEARHRTIQLFGGFRDLFLAELDISEPDFPIIQKGFGRFRRDGVSVGNAAKVRKKIVRVRSQFGLSDE